MFFSKFVADRVLVLKGVYVVIWLITFKNSNLVNSIIYKMKVTFVFILYCSKN